MQGVQYGEVTATHDTLAAQGIGALKLYGNSPRKTRRIQYVNKLTSCAYKTKSDNSEIVCHKCREIEEICVHLHGFYNFGINI